MERLTGRSLPSIQTLLEWAARLGYGARGFVYFNVGLVALLTAMGLMGDSVGAGGIIELTAGQPFGRVWLTLLGVGLWMFVLWRVLQSVADADHEGWSLAAIGKRAGQALSGVFYGILASSVFELMDEVGEIQADDGGAEAQQQAYTVMDMPYGDWLLIGAGLFIIGMGVGNIIKGMRGDFASWLACDRKTCERVVPLARAGYAARGVVYLPMGIFVVLAGLNTRAEEARSFGASLDVLQSQPYGAWILGGTGLGIMAFGAFALVEARWRRIRMPHDIKPR
ncbi:MAG: hypothetical protein C0461_00195 [Brevundimonas sp.]|nr:hypothetical protein [Brevundimonas sp.]